MVAAPGARHARGMTRHRPLPRGPPPPLRRSSRRPGSPRRRPVRRRRRQLRRSRTDKVIGGVNGGLAEYTGIDALLWRVGFVALALAGGTGVLVYLLLWLLMPAGPPAGAGRARRGRRGAGRRPARARRSPGITLAALLIVVGRAGAARPASATGIPARRAFLGARAAGRGARPGRRGLHRRPDGPRRADHARRRPVARPDRRGVRAAGTASGRRGRPDLRAGRRRRRARATDGGVGDLSSTSPASTSATSTGRSARGSTPASATSTCSSPATADVG